MLLPAALIAVVTERAAAHGAEPHERFLYVSTIAQSDSDPDFVAVVGADPEQPDFGEIVNRVDMPNVGDELHHFGYSADQRRLIVPGLFSNRIHVFDVGSDGSTMTLDVVNEDLATDSGYAVPHGVMAMHGMVLAPMIGAANDQTQPGGIVAVDVPDGRPRRLASGPGSRRGLRPSPGRTYVRRLRSIGVRTPIERSRAPYVRPGLGRNPRRPGSDPGCHELARLGRRPRPCHRAASDRWPPRSSAPGPCRASPSRRGGRRTRCRSRRSSFTTSRVIVEPSLPTSKTWIRLENNPGHDQAPLVGGVPEVMQLVADVGHVDAVDDLAEVGLFRVGADHGDEVGVAVALGDRARRRGTARAAPPPCAAARS